MKIGTNLPPLSARIQALKDTSDAQQRVDQALASMDSILATFVNASNDRSRNALITIDNDLRALLKGYRAEIARNLEQIQRDLSLIRRITQWGPAAFSLSIVVVIVICCVAGYWAAKSLIREARTGALAEIGIVATQTRLGPIYTIDPTKLTFTQCQIRETQIPCLIRQNQER
jgi:hypothetical protein